MKGFDTMAETKKKDTLKVKLKTDIPFSQILADIEAFEKAGKPNLTTMSVDWCDKYVAKAHPEDLEEYTKACLSIPQKERLNNSPAKNVKAIRNYVIEHYFPQWTEEALKKAKQEKKEKREAEKAEKEKLKSQSLEEQLKARLEALKKED